MSNDLRAGLAAVATLAAGGIALYWFPDQAKGAPSTALLLIALAVYALASGRLQEFSAPGGWKFKLASQTAVAQAPALIRQALTKASLLSKEDLQLLPQKIAAIDKTQPVVLTLQLGAGPYDSYVFSEYVKAMATLRTFVGMAILGENGGFIGYSSASQVIQAKDDHPLMQEFLTFVGTKNLPAITAHRIITTAAVAASDSQADALRLMDQDWLTSIVVVDSRDKIIGVLQRSQIVDNLLLTLGESHVAPHRPRPH
jgi:hypothetical protein